MKVTIIAGKGTGETHDPFQGPVFLLPEAPPLRLRTGEIIRIQLPSLQQFRQDKSTLAGQFRLVSRAIEGAEGAT